MEIDAFGREVRRNLESWGSEYALQRNLDYLGYCSKNLLHLLIEGGGRGMSSARVLRGESRNHADMIEEIMVDIARGNADMAIALRAYFCGRGRVKIERWETCNLMLANAGRPLMKQRVFLDMVRRGEDRVYGVLQGMALAA